MEKKKKWLKVFVSLLALAFIILTGIHILTSIIEKKIGDTLKNLSPKIDTQFSSVDVDLFNAKVSISDLHLSLAPVTGHHQHSFYSSNVGLAGINFFKIIRGKQLAVKTVSIGLSKIVLDQFLFDKNDSAKAVLGHLNIPFKKITIDRIKFEKMNTWLQSGSYNKLMLKGNITLENAQFVLNNPATFHLGNIRGTFSQIAYPVFHARQLILMQDVMIDSKKESLQADSLQIVPLNDNKVTSRNTSSLAGFAWNIESVKINKINIVHLLSTEESTGFHSKPDFLSVNVKGLRIFNTKHPYRQSVLCPQLSLTGLHFSGNSISINELKLVGPEIKLTSSSADKKPGEIIKDLPGLPAPFKSLFVKKINLLQMKIWLHSRLLLKGNLAIEDAGVTGQSANSSFHFSAIQCNFSDMNYSLSNGYYRIHVKGLLADSRKELLRMDSVQLVPQYSKLEFAKKLGHQADRIEATISQIEILKLNFGQLIHKKLLADKVIINNSHFYIFRDRRLPRTSKEEPMINGYLKKIPYQVRVHTFRLNNSNVLYEEFPKDGTQSGILKIGKMNLTMSPVVNHPYKNDPVYSEMNVKGNLMDAGTIQANIRLSLAGNTSYTKGFIRNLDLSKLNSSAENLGKFHIESGLLNELDFHFTATEKKATGEIVGEYHDLMIDKLTLKKGKKKVAKVPSFFLKHLIIPKNKDKSMNVSRRTGKISYKRDPTRFMSYYFLKALLSGIRSSFAMGFLLPK